MFSDRKYWKHVRVPFLFLIFGILKGKKKANATPLQACTGLEVSNRLRLPDFKTNST
jgi:hypothetical protein